MNEINVYCDESCHLEHDKSNIMILGAVWCPKKHVKKISKDIENIKQCHGIKKNDEIKWTKIANCNLQLYLDIIDYFFECHELHCRCYVADKTHLNHSKYKQTHDDWYYKIYFRMLENLFNRRNQFNIYVDIKDVYSNNKCQKLKEICSNNMYDSNNDYIKKIQPIRSHESQIIQITDIFIGAIGYINRSFPENHQSSIAKVEVINKIKEKSGLTLVKNTFSQEKKLNLFFWNGNQ